MYPTSQTLASEGEASLSLETNCIADSIFLWLKSRVESSSKNGLSNTHLQISTNFIQLVDSVHLSTWVVLNFQYYIISILILFIVSLGVGLKEDQSKHLLHIPLPQQLDAVRWNLANQDEVQLTCVLAVYLDYYADSFVWAGDNYR